MQWQVDHATPQLDVKEWIDEQAASMMKWPVPILSVTRLEWLPQVKSDLFIFQTPSHLAPQHAAYVAKLINTGHPVAIFGSTAGGVDPELAKMGGLLSVTAPIGDQVIPAKAGIQLAKLVDTTRRRRSTSRRAFNLLPDREK